MGIVLIGMNHKSASIEAREAVMLSCQNGGNVVSFLRDQCKAKEVFYVCTCNRVEIMVVADDSGRAAEGMEKLLSADSYPPLYRHDDIDAVRHLFRVCASLDSLVIGEPQILGQMKAAYAQTLLYGGSGIVLNKLLHFSFRCAKRTREQTRIAENPVSISYAAVELAKRIFSKLEGKTILLIGAGDMAMLAGKHFVASGVRDIIVANRTFATACDAAESFGGRAIRLDQIAEGIAAADIVVSSTGASNYIVNTEMVKVAIKRGRKSRSLFLIDIAHPRDIDPAVGNLDGVYLYDIDDLQGIVDKNTAARRQEAQKAEEIVAQEVEKFWDWLGSLALTPTIVALRKKVSGIVDAEIDKVRPWLERLGQEDQQRIKYLLETAANKFLHSPSEKLKDAQARDMAHYYSAILRDLFDL